MNLKYFTPDLVSDPAEITSLDLSNNFFGSDPADNFKEHITSLLDAAPALTNINISNNPIAPELVLDLHEIANERTQSQKMNPIFIKSDFISWLATKEINLKKDRLYYIFLEWLIIKWESSYNPSKYLAKINCDTAEHPDLISYLIPIINTRITITNRKSNTFITAAFKQQATNIIDKCFEHMGAEAFTNHLIQYLDDSFFVSYFIKRYLFNSGEDPGLALKLIVHFFPNNPAVYFELFAHKSWSENKLSEAYDMYSKAIELGNVTAVLMLLRMLEQNKIPDRPSLSDEIIEQLLLNPAVVNDLEARAQLAKLYKKKKNLTMMLHQIEYIESAINENPDMENDMFSDSYETIKMYQQFINEINLCLVHIVSIRIEQLEIRCEKNAPVYQRRLNKESIQNRLNNDLLDPSWVYIIENTRTSHLLSKYIAGNLDFVSLKKYLDQQVRIEKPGRGILSMHPRDFSAAFVGAACENLVTQRPERDCASRTAPLS